MDINGRPAAPPISLAIGVELQAIEFAGKFCPPQAAALLGIGGTD
jgi:hypothetical protein